MATLTRFEDLEVWQIAREFAASMYQLTFEQNTHQRSKI